MSILKGLLGIFQAGGAIYLNDVRISRTRTETETEWLGSGLVITDGAYAHLDGVRSERNESHGIVIEGAGTRASGSNIIVQRNKINEYCKDRFFEDDFWLGGTGALEIRSDAEVTMDNIRVSDNELEGILVHSGASANLSEATIEGTEMVDFETVDEHGMASIDDFGGIGVRVRSGGYVSLEGFSIRDCELCGIVVSLGGEADLRDGDVMNNPIGAHIKNPDFDVDRLRNNVRWDNYDVDINTSGIYVPIAENPLDDLILAIRDVMSLP